MDRWRLVENLMDSDVDDNASSIYSSHDDSGWDSSTPFELHDRVLVEPLVQPRSVNCADDDIFQEIIEFDDQVSSVILVPLENSMTNLQNSPVFALICNISFSSFRIQCPEDWKKHKKRLKS